MAAVLACEPESFLSFLSASARHNLRGGGVNVVDVSIRSRSSRSPDGIRVHRVPSLTPLDITEVDGIPCTTVARTLLDRAATATAQQLKREYDEAEHLKILNVRETEAMLDRCNGHHGAGKLQTLITAKTEPALTESEIEDLMFALCERAGLPRPFVNAAITLADAQTFHPDFYWSKQKLIVETDGRETHLTPHAFENDRRRDQHLRREGYETLRFTWSQIERDPDDVAATLQAVVGV
jgi:hypothetical protein